MFYQKLHSVLMYGVTLRQTWKGIIVCLRARKLNQRCFSIFGSLYSMMLNGIVYIYFTTYFHLPAISSKRWVQCHTIRSKFRIKICYFTAEMDDFGSFSTPSHRTQHPRRRRYQKSTPKQDPTSKNPKSFTFSTQKLVHLLCLLAPVAAVMTKALR